MFAQLPVLLIRCASAKYDSLLRSASSDYHGPEHRLFSRFLAYERHGGSPELGRLISAG